METIIIEFERVTKYPLVNFLSKYLYFLSNSYTQVDKYYSGEIREIDNKHLALLSELTSDCKNVIAQFHNFSNKFSNCGYWELMDWIDDLNNSLEKINKLPKFKKTTLTKYGYQPYMEISENIGGYRTMEDVSNSVKGNNIDNSDWIGLMHTNDLNEYDWEIDELSPVKLLINNKSDIVVTTILDMPIGNRIYGKDIARKITFKDNDFSLVEYEKNIEQKCDILLELNRGDVPEDMLFGKNISLLGGSSSQFSYPEIVNNIQNNFMQNDLFEYVNIKGFDLNNGNMTVIVEIKTKYDFKTKKNIVI